jgi:hypothetical protein
MNQRKTILIEPMKAICMQIVQQHPHATAFFGGNRLLPNNAGLIVCTADSYKTLAPRVNLAEYDVFLDEAHGLANATSPGYKLKALRAVMELLPLSRSFGFLSGTPLYHNFAPSFKSIPQIKYEHDAAAAIKKQAEFLKAENTLAAIVELVRRSIKKGRMPIVMLNDKNLRLAAIKALAEDIKLLAVNADVKDSPEFKELITHGKIPAGTQAIICTSIIQMGSSIYDQRGCDFITADMLHAAELAQATARTRNAADIFLYIVRSNKRQESDKEINAARFFYAEHKTAVKTCDELNDPARKEMADATLALHFELTIRRRIQYDPIKRTDSGLQPCELALMNNTFEAERMAQYASDKLMARELNKYGFTVIGEKRAEYGGEIARVLPAEVTTLTAEQKESVKAAKAEHKATTEAKYYSDLQELADAQSPTAVLMQADKSDTLTKVQKRVKSLIEKYALPIETAVSLLQKEKTSPQAFKHLCAEISADRLQSSSEYMEKNTMICIQIKALHRDFDKYLKEPGEATEMRRALKAVLALDSTLKLSKFEPDESDPEAVKKANQAALQFIRIFFDVSAAGKPGSRAYSRKSVFLLSKKAKFNGHRLPELRDVRLREAYEAALRTAFATEVDEPCPF